VGGEASRPGVACFKIRDAETGQARVAALVGADGEDGATYPRERSTPAVLNPA